VDRGRTELTSGGSPGILRRWAAALHRITWAAIPEAEGGRGVRLDRVIDLHKGLTGPLLAALMLGLDVFTTPAWTYLALHGSYGAAWVIKDLTFPDRQWQRRVGWTGALATWVFLSFYWVAPAILVLGQAGVFVLEGWEPSSGWLLALAVFTYALGLVLMVGSDIQKNLTLALRGGGLITTGFYARTRHPNYLGEMMVYGSFALVVNHWLPWLLLGAVWTLFFVPNMVVIDASLSRYEGYEAWRKTTGFALPRLFRTGRSRSG